MIELSPPAPGLETFAGVNSIDEFAEGLRLALEDQLSFFRAFVQRVDDGHPASHESVRNTTRVPEFSQLFHPVEPGMVVVAPLGDGSEEDVRRKIMESLRPYKNPAFGLPLQLDGKWIERRVRAKKGAPVKDPARERYASPLWIRVVRVGSRSSSPGEPSASSQWVGVFTVLRPFPRTAVSQPEQVYEFLRGLDGVREVFGSFPPVGLSPEVNPADDAMIGPEGGGKTQEGESLSAPPTESPLTDSAEPDDEVLSTESV
jgi:hypothetical protein